MAGKKQLNLTQGQKDCLRLVDDLLTSKEIARQLGISPFTVDQRLDAARRKLNAPSRKLAARIYLEIEARSLSESIVYYPDNVAAFDFIPMLSIRKKDHAKDREAVRSGNTAGEEQRGATGSVHIPVRARRTYSGVLISLLETSLISVIMVSAMTLILAGLIRALD